MRYNPTNIDPNSNKVTIAQPFDARFVQSKVEDLYNKSNFGATSVDYRYEGMLVSIIGDIDSNSGEDRTGVYLLINYSRRNYPDGWKKISCDCNFHWPPRPEPYDPDAHYYLEYNENEEPYWSKLEIHSGSGNGGYTTTEISYHMLFEDEANGGLGLERFGFLIPGTYNQEDVIPVNTPYDDIFRAILDGHQIKINGLPASDSKVYNGLEQQPDWSANVTKSSPAGYSLKYSKNSIDGPYYTYSSSIPKRQVYGVDTYYFRLIKDEDESIVIPASNSKTAIFTITKYTIKATSISKEKVFDGNPLTSNQNDVTVNTLSTFPANSVIVNSKTNSITYPGSIQNNFTLSINNSNLVEGTHTWGTLTILPLVRYTISPSTQSPPTLNTIVKDAGLSGLPKVPGESNVYYVDGKSGLTSDGVNHRFRIYVYGDQIIDNSNRWIFNDVTQTWEKVEASGAGQWLKISLTDTQQDYSKTTSIYTYSNKNSFNTEIPFEHIRLAFKVKNA